MLRTPTQVLLGITPRGIGVDDGIFSDNYTPFSPRATASYACSMHLAAGYSRGIFISQIRFIRSVSSRYTTPPSEQQKNGSKSR